MRECIDSIINQTLKEIEIICVDDASTDNSLEILKEYALKDKRIKIIKNSFNQGLSVARNVGVDASNGEYVYFLDSDDLITVNALEILYKKCKVDSLDILMFDAEVFWDNESIKESVNWSVNRYKRKYIYNNVLSGKEYFNLLHKNQDYKVNVQLLFINKQFYFNNNLRFKEGILHEDNLFTFTILLKANRVAHISEAFFKRRVREGSIMTVKESFDNAYGYFVTYLEMINTLNEVELSYEQESEATQEILKILNEAKRIYCSLDINERNKYKDLSPKNMMVFQNLIANNTHGNVNAIGEQMDVYKLIDEINVKNIELNSIKRGWSFKIGRIITWLPRKLLGRK